jgi:DNA-directed RNA polymerase subunit RPC12/RpoP
MNEFLVVCPKCRKSATVTYNHRQGQLDCSHCHHTEKSEDLVRYDVLLKRSCDTCGKLIEKKIPNNKEEVTEITIPCPHCGTTRTYKPRNERHVLYYRSDGKTDPAFNLSLWFQCDIRGHLFWAYNRAHLNEIEKYVAADLRERSRWTRMTMVERMPKFVKEAKNRDLLLRAIAKLLRKEEE